MKFKFLIISLFILFINSLTAQPGVTQQQVNYKISVTLDDEKHLLQGQVEMEYINNSPVTLDKIYIHLWANAYKNDKTAFAHQNLNSNTRDFHFAEPKDKGYFGGINFSIDGQNVSWSKYNGNEDIAEITLPKALATGQKIIIKTPFTLKIPKVFSRLGHEDQNYYMTQWFPKPAVFDEKGWHPMPYLNMGEFYSEFGNFEVSITLPANYVIGATGISSDQTSFINDRIQLTNELLENKSKTDNWKKPASSGEMKTVIFKAEKVHDFAWFASKEFLVVADTAVLKNGKRIPAFGYFMLKNSKNWKKSAFFTKRAVEYLSDRVGEYPWPHASAVDGELIAGGGMEYPMITIISGGGSEKSLDNVIEHEVGHNWFYGILASNERDHAWMDEGINSYYEAEYMSLYYPPQKLDKMPKMGIGINADFEALAFKFLHKRKLDQALSLTSKDFATINYGLDVYKKTARYFKVLESYLGTEVFNKSMKEYYRQWSFKHPYPADLQAVLEKSSGKNLSWLFKDLIDENKPVDYKILNADAKSVTLMNKGKNQMPIPLTIEKQDGTKNVLWVDGFQGSKTVELDLNTAKTITIDADDQIMDLNLGNNYYHTSGLFKNKRPIRLSPFGLLESKKYNKINLMPAIGWNNCDKTMLGLLVSSPAFPGRNFRYYLAPMIATAGGSIVGQGRIEQNFYSYKTIERFSIGVFGKSYTNFVNTEPGFRARYSKIAPYISMEFARWKPWSHKITFTSNILIKEDGTFDNTGNYTGKKSENSYIHTLDYDLTSHHAVRPVNARFRLEQQSYNEKEHYVKLTADWRTKLYYNTKKSIDVRLFAGAFLENTKRKSGAVNSDFFARGSMSLASTGADDYLFEGPYQGRTSTSGFFSKQVDISDGGFKFPLGYKYGQFGYTNSFLASVNIKAGLPAEMPLKLPLKPYFDLGYFDDQRPINSDKTWQDNVVWAGGFMLDFGDFIGFYFPVVQSKSLDDQYKQSVGSNYLKRITFSLQLPVARISEIVKSVKL